MAATQRNPSTVLGSTVAAITKQWECNLFPSNQCCSLELYLRDSSYSAFTSLNSKTDQKFVYKLRVPQLKQGEVKGFPCTEGLHPAGLMLFG